MTVTSSARTQGRLIELLRRHMVLLGALGLIGAAGGAAFAQLAPTPYTATASVLVTPLEGNPYSPQGRGDDLINLETEAQLVGTDAVARRALDKLGTGDPVSLRQHVSIEVPSNTQVLSISFTASTATQAQRGAAAFAESYLEYRGQRAQDVLDGRLKKLQDNSNRITQRLQETTKKLASATGAQRSFLLNRIDAYTNQLGVIDEQANDISSTSVSPGQIITPATLPAGGQSLRFAGLGLGGLVTGLAFGIGLVLVRDRTARRIKRPETLEQLGLGVLVAVPPAESGLVVAEDPSSAATDAYRRLRASIVARHAKPPVVLLVCGITPEVGTMATSANLAVTLAFAGSRTVLVDSGAAGTDVAELFRLTAREGLAETLLDDTAPISRLVRADSNLDLLPRGGFNAASADFLGGPRMRKIIESLRSDFSFVLINGPSVQDINAQALGQLADAVILVAFQGVTSRAQAQQALFEVGRWGTPLEGAVLEHERPDLRERPSAPDGEELDTWLRGPARRLTPPRTAHLAEHPAAAEGPSWQGGTVER